MNHFFTLGVKLLRFLFLFKLKMIEDHQVESCKCCEVNLDNDQVHCRCNVCDTPFCSYDCAITFYCSCCNRSACMDCFPHCDICFRKEACHNCMGSEDGTLCSHCR